MNISLAGRKVLVTGGTGSIGGAMVKAFLVAGAEVWFQYHSRTEIAATLSRLGAHSICMDFRQGVLLGQGAFDVLVSNAGVNISRAISHEVTTDAWSDTLAVNLQASYLLVKQCLPFMLGRRWGRIIAVSSIYGLRGSENNLPYNVSKHGLSGLIKTLAREYGHQGITANEICPGPVDSELLWRIAREKEANGAMTAQEYVDTLAQRIPAGRLAQPREVAALALFLASDEAAFINGASIPVDGGMIA